MAATDFAISKFKTSLAQGGARPSLFSVLFDYPTVISDPPTVLALDKDSADY